MILLLALKLLLLVYGRTVTSRLLHFVICNWFGKTVMLFESWLLCQLGDLVAKMVFLYKLRIRVTSIFDLIILKVSIYFHHLAIPSFLVWQMLIFLPIFVWNTFILLSHFFGHTFWRLFSTWLLALLFVDMLPYGNLLGWCKTRLFSQPNILGHVAGN